MIDLRPFESLGKIQRLSVSGELVTAARQNPQLKRELPFVAQAYGSSQPAVYSRLSRIARAAPQAHLQPAVITANGSAIGIASAQLTANFRDLPLPTESRAVELSYWHAHPLADSAELRGRRIMHDLLVRAKQPTMDAEVYWSVTLPEDGMKTRVLRHAGFLAVDRPQQYELGDGAVVPRQLWSRPVTY